MTDQDRERERKKSRLRSRMLVTDSDGRKSKRPAPQPVFQKETAPPAAEKDDRYELRLFLYRALKSLLVLIPAVGLVVGAFILYTNFQNKEYLTCEVSWEKEIAEGGASVYTAYGSNVLKYNQDGASYINSAGDVVWNEAYEMRAPMVAINGSYAAIADREGRSIYIFDENGCQGQVSTTLPVTAITVAGQGMVAALLEEDEVCYINFFDRAGGRLDIEVKMWMNSQGYPVSFALSPSGTQMMLSCIYADAGSMQNKLAFLNFSEVGEELQDRTAGGFELGGTVSPQVIFMGDTRACAFLDNGLAFFSMQQLSPKTPLLPEPGTRVTYAEEIRSVFYDNTRIGVITAGRDGDFLYQLYLYDSSGRLLLDKGIDFDYETAQVSNYGICLYNDSECRIYALNGRQKYAGELGGTIGKIVMLSPYRLLRIGDQKVAEVVLQ